MYQVFDLDQNLEKISYLRVFQNNFFFMSFSRKRQQLICYITLSLWVVLYFISFVLALWFLEFRFLYSVCIVSWMNYWDIFCDTLCKLYWNYHVFCHSSIYFPSYCCIYFVAKCLIASFRDCWCTSFVTPLSWQWLRELATLSVSPVQNLQFPLTKS